MESENRELPRILTDHHTNDCNAGIEVRAGARDSNRGNGVFEYDITYPDCDGDPHERLRLHFHSGPMLGRHTNGITNEVLLAVLIDRLRAFQDGQFRTREGALALTKAEECLHWLAQRTRLRDERGVEGTHQP